MSKYHIAVTTELDDTNILHFSFNTARELAHWLKLRSRPAKTKRGAVALKRIVLLEER